MQLTSKMRFFRRRMSETSGLAAQISYLEHLLKQRYTLRKRALMRYFPSHFFYFGEVFQMHYAPWEQELRFVLNSPSAMDAACQRYAKRGLSQEQYLPKMQRKHFQYEVRFVNVKAIRVASRWAAGNSYPTPLDSLFDVELSDATWPQWRGYTVLKAFFLEASLALLFQTAHVRPLYPKQLMRHLGRAMHVDTLLSGGDTRAALCTELAGLRKRMNA